MGFFTEENLQFTRHAIDNVFVFKYFCLRSCVEQFGPGATRWELIV